MQDLRTSSFHGRLNCSRERAYGFTANDVFWGLPLYRSAFLRVYVKLCYYGDDYVWIHSCVTLFSTRPPCDSRWRKQHASYPWCLSVQCYSVVISRIINIDELASIDYYGDRKNKTVDDGTGTIINIAYFQHNSNRCIEKSQKKLCRG